MGDLESFFNDLVGTVADATSEEIVQVTNSIIQDVIDALGIQDWYGIYMTGFCDGEYTTSKRLKTTTCTPYSKLASRLLNFANS